MEDQNQGAKKDSTDKDWPSRSAITVEDLSTIMLAGCLL